MNKFEDISLTSTELNQKEVLTHVDSNLLYKIGQDFLDIQ